MSELKLFKNAQFGAVRVVMVNGDPWFVARDVATCLGYTNPAKAVRDHCKRAIVIGEQMSAEPQSMRGNESFTPVNSGSQNIGNCSPLDPQTKLIPEADVYRLVTRSDLPAAEIFQDWVCEEVLPSIRKTGMYAPRTYLEALKALVAEVEAKEKAQAALVQEQAARAEIQQQLNKQIAVTDELLVRLGLAGSYLQVKGFPYIYRIALALPKDANQRFWGPIGKAVSAICRSHGGIELSPQKVATTWGQFENRGPWDMVQFPDPQYTTIHVYPVCAMEEFKQLLISGFYDTYKFAQYLHNDFKTILSTI